MDNTNETVVSNRRSKVPSSMERMCGMCCGGNKKWLIVFIVIFLVLWGLSHWFGVFSGVDRSSYQAVFLTNGQVYFGQLRSSGMGFLLLKDAHYLQIAATPEGTSAVLPVNLNLISIKNQPQGPLGSIYIPRNQIIFWENLKSDSEAIKIIEEQKTGE